MRLSHTDFNPSIEDYANPLTRFTMQDYPEDGGKGMSEVFNGEKILFELPSPLAAKVDGEIYFINELLQDVTRTSIVGLAPIHFLPCPCL
jgi:hypothetical protein